MPRLSSRSACTAFSKFWNPFCGRATQDLGLPGRHQIPSCARTDWYRMSDSSGAHSGEMARRRPTRGTAALPACSSLVSMVQGRSRAAWSKPAQATGLSAPAVPTAGGDRHAWTACKGMRVHLIGQAGWNDVIFLRWGQVQVCLAAKPHLHRWCGVQNLMQAWHSRKQTWSELYSCRQH